MLLSLGNKLDIAIGLYGAHHLLGLGGHG